MTDNEIIKALEGLASIKIKYGAEKLTVVEINFLTDTLDLIKRQQAEIEELQILTGLMRKRTYYNKFVKEVFQKEKGSNLVYPDADEIYKRYFEQQAEIERLEKESLDKERAYTEEYIVRKELKSKLKTTKAEAVKEFAEKLKEKLWSPTETWLTDDIVTETQIDEVLKEMEGE